MRLARIAAVLLTALTWGSTDAAAADGRYCVCVSKATNGEPAWKEVVDALATKHKATVLVYEQSVDEVLPKLRDASPRYIGFVARPNEAGRAFVAGVNRLTRRLDADPYTDALWGIVTGYDAANALRIAKCSEPLVIHRSAAGTEIELSACEEGRWFCELTAGKMVQKDRGKEPRTEKVPVDTTKALVDTLNVYRPQLFVTSGHATERDWQIGYRYRNGQFRSKAGQLFGVDRQGQQFPVDSDNPKVYLPVGNCLMGHVDGPDAMALAWLNSAGVDQMAGYTVPTWYGYAGWGLLDYFVEQPGRFTLAEAFFANQQALVHRLATFFPGLEAVDPTGAKFPQGESLPAPASKAGLSWHDARGLLYDRDTLAFYGDPAWSARMAPGPLSWQQTLSEKDGLYRFEIRPLRGKQSFEPVNRNGSQRGGRPMVEFLPAPIKADSIQILEGAELAPLVTDNFILVPNPMKCDPDRTYRVVFRASRDDG